jgi:hypothetical protein
MKLPSGNSSNGFTADAKVEKVQEWTVELFDFDDFEVRH